VLSARTLSGAATGSSISTGRSPWRAFTEHADVAVRSLGELEAHIIGLEEETT
jgi:hypothetical protein